MSDDNRFLMENTLAVPLPFRHKHNQIHHLIICIFSIAAEWRQKSSVLLCWVEKLLRTVHVNIISPFGKSKSYLTKYRLYSNKASSTWFRCLNMASSASVHMPAFPGWPERAGSNDTSPAGDPCPAGDAAALYKGNISQHLETALDVYI